MPSTFLNFCIVLAKIAQMAPRPRSPGPGIQDVPEWLKTGVRPEILRGGGGSFTGFTTSPYKSAWAQSTLMQRDESILIRDDGDPGEYVGNGFSSRSFKADTPRVHAGTKDPLAPASRASFNKNSSRGNGSFNTRVKTRAASAPRSSVRTGDPGSYDFAPRYACGGACTGSTKVTSSFRTQLPVAGTGHVRPSSTPGVGHYEPHVRKASLPRTKQPLERDDHNFSRGGAGGASRSSFFAGDAISRTLLADELASRTEPQVGPGRYEHHVGRSIEARASALKARGKKLAPFGSTSSRESDYW